MVCHFPLSLFPDQTEGNLIIQVRAGAMDDVLLPFPGKAAAGKEKIDEMVRLPVQKTADPANIEGVNFKPLTLLMAPHALIGNAEDLNEDFVFVKCQVSIHRLP